jgi:hypothetical protein
MGDRLIESVVTIALAIVGVATIAVLVSRNANTAGVISAGGGAFSQSLEVAEGPVLSSGINALEAPGVNSYY